jgi:hypothetical protein
MTPFAMVARVEWLRQLPEAGVEYLCTISRWWP